MPIFLRLENSKSWILTDLPEMVIFFGSGFLEISSSSFCFTESSHRGVSWGHLWTKTFSARNEKLNIEIDFYPDAKWGDLRYARTGVISQNKRMNKKHGIEAKTPKAEHEIYMIASHAYGHVRTNLLEVLNTIKIIIDEKPNFSEIIQLAEKFHLQNPTLVLFSLANNFMKKFGYSEIDKEYFKKLERISNRRFVQISHKEFEIDDFPFKYSLSDLVSASLDKFTAKNLDETANKTDELNGFIKHNRIANAVYTRFLSSHYGKFIPNKALSQISVYL